MLALNGNIVVTPVSLKVKCHEKYTFRSGKNVLEAECQAGQWTVPPEDIQGDRVVCFREYKFHIQRIGTGLNAGIFFTHCVTVLYSGIY